MERSLIRRLLPALFVVAFATASLLGAERPRLLVLTDIGGDPDDQQSLIRLLLYANEFEIEGLIASASGTPGELKEAVTQPQLIRELVEAYGQVYPRLTNHALGYPPPPELLARIRSGNPQRGRPAIGEGHDTEGSRLIVEAADRPDSRPLNITIWGGQTDFAQACWAVRSERGVDGLRKFLARIRVYDIDDQDRIADWMMAEFAPPFYVLSHAFPGHDKREGAYRGMYLGDDEALVSREWMERNIRQGHGPLGALYPPRTWTAPNPHSAIKEGDTPSWFYFLPLGFNEPNFPDWGGWGGRFQQATNGVWRDAQDAVGGITDARSTVSRWRAAFQSEFAARADWCVMPYHEANHRPIGVVNGTLEQTVVHLDVKPGEKVRLDPGQSLDPDGDRLSFKWWRYWEAGTWRQEVEYTVREGAILEVKIPPARRIQTLHFMLEVIDDGTPRLTGFRRVVLTILPETGVER